MLFTKALRAFVQHTHTHTHTDSHTATPTPTHPYTQPHRARATTDDVILCATSCRIFSLRMHVQHHSFLSIRPPAWMLPVFTAMWSSVFLLMTHLGPLWTAFVTPLVSSALCCCILCSMSASCVLSRIACFYFTVWYCLCYVCTNALNTDVLNFLVLSHALVV